MLMESHLSRFKSEVAEAFYGVIYPPDGRILGGGDAFELKDFLHTSFSDSSWQDIPLDIVKKNYAALRICLQKLFE
jgi:hypothetical protein